MGNSRYIARSVVILAVWAAVMAVAAFPIPDDLVVGIVAGAAGAAILGRLWRWSLGAETRKAPPAGPKTS